MSIISKTSTFEKKKKKTFAFYTLRLLNIVKKGILALSRCKKKNEA